MTAKVAYQPGRRILECAAREPDKIALRIAGESWTYAELLAAAAAIAK